jgi:hypothetical protein
MIRFRLKFRIYKAEIYLEGHLSEGGWENISKDFVLPKGYNITVMMLCILQEHGIKIISNQTLAQNQISCCQID